ncbi:hypothetical protein AB0K51_31040 [Kitasatospora sp. NPDC049285]|uniref:hypothetical protein n=1 Tax=Kitasatospora sp. NPDC049285 TaxID=3157096 RepID=UPI00342BF0C2
MEHPDDQPELAAAVRELAAAVSEPAGDAADEHRRWELYQRGADLSSARPALARAIAAEPVPSLASAVVVMLLPDADPEERLRLVALLPSSVRRFALDRARELAVLDTLHRPDGPPGFTADEVVTWSDWLQRRAAEASADPRLLTLLADQGRTKRIRSLAAATLREQHRRTEER